MIKQRIKNKSDLTYIIYHILTSFSQEKKKNDATIRKYVDQIMDVVEAYEHGRGQKSIT